MYQLHVIESTPKLFYCTVYRNQKIVTVKKASSDKVAVKEAVREVRMIRRGKNW